MYFWHTYFKLLSGKTRLFFVSFHFSFIFFHFYFNFHNSSFTLFSYIPYFLSSSLSWMPYMVPNSYRNIFYQLLCHECHKWCQTHSEIFSMNFSVTNAIHGARHIQRHLNRQPYTMALSDLRSMTLSKWNSRTAILLQSL